jgi:hypothetical protein
MSQWSIAVRIDDADTGVHIEFSPQKLLPAEYGVVLASLVLHIASCFKESNPGAPLEAIVSDILSGIQSGLVQLPQRPPSSQH